MAFRVFILSTLLAIASAGVLHPVSYAHVANPAVDAVATTHQNVVRSFDGTVSQYSKNIETPYSSAHKFDTRISKNAYTPAVAKTLTYAAPSELMYDQRESTPIGYTHPEAVYTHAAPASKTVSYAAPASFPASVYHHATPVSKPLSYAAPASAPVYHQHATPVTTTTYNHGPVAATYSHNSPGVATYGGSHQTMHYSPAEMVSHVSFDGFGTHWGF